MNAVRIRQAHHKRQREKRKARQDGQDPAVRSVVSIIIPPQTCRKVSVRANFAQGQEHLYIEKEISFNKNPEDAYGCPDSLISRTNPFLHVSNFSSSPVRISPGQVLGTAHNPQNWLDYHDNTSPELAPKVAHAALVRSLAETLLKTGDPSPTREPIPDVVEGGPKTAEPPPEMVESSALFDAINFSKDLTPEQRKSIEEVVWRNRDAFALDGRLGNYNETFVDIPLKPGAKPVSLPPFGASSPEKRRVMDEQMDSWINLEVIEPSKSPWGAPGFITYRNGKPRMVIDYRKLNELVIPDEFPLPKQEDILQSLTGSQWLSTLDALAGFTQLQINPEDREKTGFRTHRGLYQFKRMPFGFRNGPACFQRVMQNVLAPFLWIFALVYIDDIVIFSRTFEEHVTHLEAVFASIAKSGITLSPKKCNLGYQSLQLLGQKVSRLGLSTHKEKIDAIVDLAEPRNIKELQTFLGMMVYFSAYIPFYAWIVAPLFQLLKKGQEWEWGPLQREAFELAKTTLTNAPVRAYAIPGQGYRIYSDACDYGVAAILQQIQPIKIRDLRDTKVYERLKKAHRASEPIPRLVATVSKEETDVPTPGEWAPEFDDTEVHIERVIAYWSRSLKSAERNYSPTEREALALRDGLVKFQGYIEGEKVISITDHAALTWARTFQNVNRRLLTWGTIFAAYPDMRIVHRAGRVHSNVDPISRLRRRVPFQEGPNADPSVPAPIIAEEEPLDVTFSNIDVNFEARILRVVAGAVLMQEKQNRGANSVGPPVSMEASVLGRTCSFAVATEHSLISNFNVEDRASYMQGYEEDSHFQDVLLHFRSQEDARRSAYTQYFLNDDGLIYFQDWRGGDRLCVPTVLRAELMREAHEGISEAAHGGFEKTYNRLATTHYWPRMSRDIKQFTGTCDICQKAKPRKHAPYGLLQPYLFPERPFDVISMDFITELPVSDGFDTVLVVVDKLTKYGLFIPTKASNGEKETGGIVFKHVIRDYGLPRQLVTDRDPRWTGDFWKEICQCLGMKRALTTAHHPQGDGQTEVLNQRLEIALRAYIGPERDDWAKLLDTLQLAYNSSTHSSTKFSPAHLLRGYQPRTALNLDSYLESDIGERGDDSQEWLARFQANLQRAHDSLVLAQNFQQQNYNQGRLTMEFEEGDLVLLNAHSMDLLRTVKGRGKKLLMKFDGPFEISQKISPLAYRLRMPVSYGMNPVINIAHLEPYRSSPPEFGERSKRHLRRKDFEDLPELEVAEILQERKRKIRGGKR